ncbi:MAG: universal stress protein [Actinomycetota bacterium]|nr:universal stress protein [Actinomycetota bacterium]MDQ2894416.1 universal stress protein [Actinomycetota bacterium]
MTTSPSPLPVVVGIDGTTRSIEATRWAAHEAARRGTGLRLMHAGYPIYLHPLPDQRGVADGAMAEAYAAATEAEPALNIETVEAIDRPAHYLLEHSDRAAMIVLGTHAGNSIAGALFGSIAQTVAAHAMCPVVVIGEPQPAEYAATGPVVVGVSNHPGGIEALHFAFAAAAETGADLIAVRSWGDVDWGNGRLGYNTQLFAEWRRLEGELLDTCLAGVESQFPKVTVHRRLEGERADHALQRVARGARLLVVGTHRRDDHWFSRLGPAPSWLMHRSPCPLAIVGQPHSLPAETADPLGGSSVREPAHAS